MNKNCGIYKITNPKGRVYIGQAKDLIRRNNNYVKMRCERQPRLYASFKKYGWEAHQFDIIEYCDVDQLNCSERFWQDEFDVLGKEGLNCRLVKCGNIPGEDSEYLAKKKGVRKGFKHSQATKDILRIMNTGENHPNWGKSHSKETIEKIRKSNTGLKRTEESKRRMSEVRTGNSRSGASNNKSKMVLCMTTGIFYECAREAAQALGIPYHRLISYLLGTAKNKTSMKYV